MDRNPCGSKCFSANLALINKDGFRYIRCVACNALVRTTHSKDPPEPQPKTTGSCRQYDFYEKHTFVERKRQVPGALTKSFKCIYCGVKYSTPFSF